MMSERTILFFTFLFCILSCNIKEEKFVNPKKRYKTENVIVIVVDGARYSETWGDSTHKHIPFFANKIANSGIVNTEFYNNGYTKTVSGFTAITTGSYQNMNNKGKEFPKNPSIFQSFVKYNSLKSKNLFSLPLQNKNSWILNSKHTLGVLGNSIHPDWKNKYLPSLDCGYHFIFPLRGLKYHYNGMGSYDRHDTLTLVKFFNVTSKYKPNLILIGFNEPDVSGHKNSWKGYVEGIQDTDKYIYKIWDYIQKNQHYKGKTTLFITNDHGRHLDKIKSPSFKTSILSKIQRNKKNNTKEFKENSQEICESTQSVGWSEHGDDCLGCRHVIFFAFGPDFKTGKINNKRELIDIPATIAELLQFDSKYIEGEVMYELFDNYSR